jgi:hypothetical protein
MHIAIVSLFEIKLARYLVVKNLIVVAQARQYDSFGEHFIEVLNLLCYLGPHFVPVVNLSIL